MWCMFTAFACRACCVCCAAHAHNALGHVPRTLPRNARTTRTTLVCARGRYRILDHLYGARPRRK